MSGSDTSAVVDALQRFEDMRKPHTGPVSQGAHVTGKIFHHAPAVLRPLLAISCSTTRRFFRRTKATPSPRKRSLSWTSSRTHLRLVIQAG